MYTSSAAANNENAVPSSASWRLKASQANPAPSAKAATCTTRKNPVGNSLIQLPQGICSSSFFESMSERLVPSGALSLLPARATRRGGKTAGALDTREEGNKRLRRPTQKEKR